MSVHVWVGWWWRSNKQHRWIGAPQSRSIYQPPAAARMEQLHQGHDNFVRAPHGIGAASYCRHGTSWNEFAVDRELARANLWIGNWQEPIAKWGRASGVPWSGDESHAQRALTETRRARRWARAQRCARALLEAHSSGRGNHERCVSSMRYPRGPRFIGAVSQPHQLGSEQLGIFVAPQLGR